MGWLKRLFGGTGGEQRDTRLVDAMTRVALQDNAVTRRALYLVLLNAQILVPCDEQTARMVGIRGGILRAKSLVRLTVLASAAGDEAVAAFTDEPNLREFSRDASHIVVAPADLCRLIRSNSKHQGLVLNPEGSPTGMLAPEEVAAIAKRQLPRLDGGRELTEDTEMLYGRPKAPPPMSWQYTVKKVMAGVPEVRSAHMLLVILGATPPVLTVAIDFQDGVGPDAQNKLLSKLSAKVPDDRGSPVQLMAVKDDMRASLAEMGAALFER